MNRLMYLAIFAILLLTACSKDQPVSPDLVQVENVAGTYYRTLITSDGKDREFIVYVPESAVGNKNIPVVIMIHGTGSTGQIFHDDPDLWVPKAKMEGFITVHPTALVHCHFDNGLEKTTTKWSHGDLGENNTDMGGLPLCSGEELANDLEFFDMMIDVLKTDTVSMKKGFMLLVIQMVREWVLDWQPNALMYLLQLLLMQDYNLYF